LRINFNIVLPAPTDTFREHIVLTFGKELAGIGPILLPIFLIKGITLSSSSNLSTVKTSFPALADNYLSNPAIRKKYGRLNGHCVHPTGAR
jgi:hypothetical protein